MSRPIRALTENQLRRLGHGVSIAVLTAGALLFFVPFLTMLSTSVKLDEEMSSDQFHLLPTAPIPRHASPYAMEDSGIALHCPADMDSHDWLAILPRLEQVASSAVETWWDSEPQMQSSFSGVDRDQAVRMLTPVVATDMLNQLSDRARTQGTGAMLAELPSLVDDQKIAGAFDQYVPRFCLGDVRIGRPDFSTAVVAGAGDWRVSRGDARMFDLSPPLSAKGQHVRLMQWNADAGGDAAATVAPADLDPASAGKVDRIYVAYRSDQSWADLQFEVVSAGRRYLQDEPLYAAQRRWTEVELRLPGPEPEPFSGRSYLRLRDIGQAYPGSPALAVTLHLRPTSTAGAWWAKATRNYRTVFRQVPMFRYIATSISLAILTILLTVFGSSLSAYAFARIDFPGRGVLFGLLLATMMIPPQVTMIPAFMINRSLGWFNTLYPLWVPAMFGSAFFIFMLRQFFLAVPRELEDAARIDGCGFLRIYWHVMLPLVRPTLYAVAIFAFLGSWNNFMGPLIYVNDERLDNLAFGLFKFRMDSGGNSSLLMAGAFVMTVPIIALFFFFQRYFVRGISLTGLGGR